MIYFGIVEDRTDPLKLGRCKVRIVGLHSPVRDELPTDDLPWAYPIQPITSAAISGVGYAPVGLVEGSWVCVIFKDTNQQIPIILGSVGGIPTDGNKQLEYKKTNEYIVKPPFLIEGYSSSVIDTIKSREQLRLTATFVYADGTIDPTNEVNRLSLDELNEMSDGGKWILPEGTYFIVGYKSRAIQGVTVFKGTSITKQTAEEQLKEDVDTIFSTLMGVIKAPITQSMIDALLLVAHDIGLDNFLKTPILAELNGGNYTQASAFIQLAFTDNSTKLRRVADKTLFLKEGTPTSSGEPVSDTLNSAFADDAFMNPGGIYPLYLNEPDTNRLARHENIGSTIIAFKESARVTGLSLANGETIDQPRVPYNADYPFNKVYATESGHLMEFDDTPSSERVHIYHKSGTFTEVDVNGSQVNRVVGDAFAVYERNGTLYVKGGHNVVVDGASTLRVSGVMDVQVTGTTNISIYNDANVNISGNANIAVGEEFNVKAKKIKMEADEIHFKSSGNIFADAGGDLNLKGISTFLQGMASTDIKTAGLLNMAYASASFGVSAASASGAETSGLSDPDARQTASSINLSTLVVPERTFREASIYETPDEGDSTEFKEARLSGGTLLKSEDVPEPAKEESTLTKNTIQPPVSSCDVIFAMNDIPKNLQLSENFNLLQMTKNGSRPVIAQGGLSRQEIVCNLKGLCENCLEPIREMYPNMVLTSVFRRPGDAPGSSAKSQHYNGQAADIVLSGFSKKQVYDAILEIQKRVPYDQLILEYSGASTVWIHVSFVYSNARKQAFTMKNHSRISPFGKYLLV